MAKSNKKLETEIRELEKRVAALEKQLNDHMFGNNDEPLASSGDRTFGYIAGTYNTKTGESTPGGDFSQRKEEPSKPKSRSLFVHIGDGIPFHHEAGFRDDPVARGAVRNTGMGSKFFKPTAYDADVPE